MGGDLCAPYCIAARVAAALAIQSSGGVFNCGPSCIIAQVDTALTMHSLGHFPGPQKGQSSPRPAPSLRGGSNLGRLRVWGGGGHVGEDTGASTRLGPPPRPSTSVHIPVDAKRRMPSLCVFHPIWVLGGGGPSKGTGAQPAIIQFSSLTSSKMVIFLPSSRCLGEGNRILVQGPLLLFLSGVIAWWVLDGYCISICCAHILAHSILKMKGNVWYEGRASKFVHIVFFAL